MSNGDAVNFIPIVFAIFLEAGVFESLVDNREDGFEMGTGGDFWDNSAIAFENINLGNYDVGKNCRFSIG